MRAGKHRKSKPEARPRRALVQRPGMALPVVRLNREKQWRDVYHRLLTLTWPRFFLVVAAWYVAINVAFALLYQLEPGAIGLVKTYQDADYYYSLSFNGRSYTIMRDAALVANAQLADPTHWAWRTSDESYIRVRAVANGTSYGDASGTPVRGGVVNGTWLPRVKWQVWTQDNTVFEFAEEARQSQDDVRMGSYLKMASRALRCALEIYRDRLAQNRAEMELKEKLK